MKKFTQEVYATEAQADMLYAGMYKKNFTNWSKVGDEYFTPLGELCAIEKKRNRYMFHNYVDNNIYPISDVEFTTLDNIHFFIRIVIDGGMDMFIPIR